MTQLSFNNDPSLKALHVSQAEHHAAADMLRAGTFGDAGSNDFKGCSVGCFAHEIDPALTGDLHTTAAEARGLPVWLVRLQDSMFEGLPTSDRATFHVQLAKRIPVGVNLDPVPHLIAVARIDRMSAVLTKLLDAHHAFGVPEAIEQTIAALVLGRRAHEAAAGGNFCELETAARSAAWSAWSARSAAESAARSTWQNERDALFAALGSLTERN